MSFQILPILCTSFGCAAGAMTSMSYQARDFKTMTISLLGLASCIVGFAFSVL